MSLATLRNLTAPAPRKKARRAAGTKGAKAPKPKRPDPTPADFPAEQDVGPGSPLRPQDGAPLIVNFGGGVDSTALLVGMVRRGVRPDLVIYADTGSEKPETIAWIATFSAFLTAHGFPAVTVVRRGMSRASHTGPGYDTIEGNCLQNATLPSLAYFLHGCSMKWKREPMDAWLSRWAPQMAARARGVRPVKLIGYDCSPADNKRAVKLLDDWGHRYRYPLREWGWDRVRCLAEIRAAGLVPPVKSACWMCPASQPEEVLDLARVHRNLLLRAIVIEDRAAPFHDVDAQTGLPKTRGLGMGRGDAGWSWRGLIETAAARGEVAPLPVDLIAEIEAIEGERQPPPLVVDEVVDVVAMAAQVIEARPAADVAEVRNELMHAPAQKRGRGRPAVVLTEDELALVVSLRTQGLTELKAAQAFCEATGRKVSARCLARFGR